MLLIHLAHVYISPYIPHVYLAYILKLPMYIDLT
jgi:hypothetical protein